MNVTVSELRGRALSMYLRSRTVFCWSTCASFVWCRIDGLQLVLGTLLGIRLETEEPGARNLQSSYRALNRLDRAFSSLVDVVVFISTFCVKRTVSYAWAVV